MRQHRVQRNTHSTTSRVERSRENNNPTRYYSKRQEDTVAREFNGQRQKNSGATQFEKGDVKLEDVLLECKTKTSPSNSISIKKEWLTKNDEEALFMGKKYGVLAFNFGPGEDNYYIINSELFHLLIDKIDN